MILIQAGVRDGGPLMWRPPMFCFLRPLLLSSACAVALVAGAAEAEELHGQIVGAIGVSADTTEHDEVIANTALAALVP
jgi:uncharacterized protein GlcG (DUF336 family)